MTLIDTHAHLYWDSYKEDLDQVIQRAIEADVTTIINVGVDIEKSKIALEQVRGKLSKFSGFSAYSTIGIHPHESVKYRTNVSIHEDMEKLEQIYLSDTTNVIAVGECGLDFFFDNNPDHNPSSFSIKQKKSLQISLFQAQIDLAKKLNLPLIVHCRDDRSKDPENSEAWDKVLEMVENHSTILHCYSGLSHTTNFILLASRSEHATDLYVSFAATLTYPKNEYLREAAKLIPLDRIVLETDCPFLPPQTKRGQRNEPANVYEIAKLIAELKEVSLEKLSSQINANVAQIFAF